MMADAMPDPTATTQAPAFANATPVQDAPFTSGLNPSTTILAAAASSGRAGGANSVNGAGHWAAAMPTAALFAGGAAAVLANF